MFAAVRIFSHHTPLWYTIPSEYTDSIAVGSIVKVPLRAKQVRAYVMHISAEKPGGSFALRSITNLEPFPADTHYYTFIEKVARYYRLDPICLIERLQPFFAPSAARKHKTTPHNPHEKVHRTQRAVVLTPEQQEAVTFLQHAIEQATFTPTVLHGVTGSGKTVVYAAALNHAYAQHKSSMIILPEISLALHIHHALQKLCNPAIPLYLLHSGTTPAERRALWHAVIAGQPLVLIGVHLPLLVPLATLGLIIIDEEHDVGYQEKKHPKINSKEVGLLRAQQYGVPLLLCSATPSITTLHVAQHKKWPIFNLTQRFAGAFPTVERVNLLDSERSSCFWISKTLEAHIQQRLERKEQVILFLNRRGHSFFIQCTACSFIFGCPHCSVSLTLHDTGQLSCHYCGLSMPQPTFCTACKASSSYLLKKGIGTQQLTTILQNLFPTARIARADLDTTRNKKAWDKTVQLFAQGELDIMIGTQTITKGYDFSGVTLVGIIWADLQVHFPLYNATETALQQLIQVAGRAGRASAQSTVVVQTMVDHPIFHHLAPEQYLDFYQQEVEQRTLLRYPPYVRLVEVEFKHHDEAVVAHEIQHYAQRLQQALIKKNYQETVYILGPAKPPVHKIKNWHMQKLYMKAKSLQHIYELLDGIESKGYKSSIFVTPNPLQ